MPAVDIDPVALQPGGNDHKSLLGELSAVETASLAGVP